MTDSNLISLLLVFAGGLLTGVLLILLFNKLRSGSASPATVKRELEDYQKQVEAHFDETSDKFKAMAEQYKDLYQHLSVGATTLCRPDHVVPGLTDESDPLQSSARKLPAKASAENPDEKRAEKPGKTAEKLGTHDGNDGKSSAKKQSDQGKNKDAVKTMDKVDKSKPEEVTAKASVAKTAAVNAPDKTPKSGKS